MDRPGLILVDTSAWVEMLRATESPVDRRLTRLVEEEAELATTEPVELELLAGVRGPNDELRIETVLAACELIPISSIEDWRHAAAVYRTCRRSGATPRRLLDCLIAATAIRAEVPVLAFDRDFERIAEHTPLKLAT
ncbi:MAG: type II toxin-antitoxin system VapC family toxin [Solirubrobacterales bacterium]